MSNIYAKRITEVLFSEGVCPETNDMLQLIERAKTEKMNSKVFGIEAVKIIRFNDNPFIAEKVFTACLLANSEPIVSLRYFMDFVEYYNVLPDGQTYQCHFSFILGATAAIFAVDNIFSKERSTPQLWRENFIKALVLIASYRNDKLKIDIGLCRNLQPPKLLNNFLSRSSDTLKRWALENWEAEFGARSFVGQMIDKGYPIGPIGEIMLTNMTFARFNSLELLGKCKAVFNSK